MTKPRTLEEIAHGLWVRDEIGALSEEQFLTALREAADTAEAELAAAKDDLTIKTAEWTIMMKENKTQCAELVEAQAQIVYEQERNRNNVAQYSEQLAAANERVEKLEKAVQRHLMAIGHDAADETDCDVGFGCTLCELSKALRHDAPEPTPSEEKP